MLPIRVVRGLLPIRFNIYGLLGLSEKTRNPPTHLVDRNNDTSAALPRLKEFAFDKVIQCPTKRTRDVIRSPHGQRITTIIWKLRKIYNRSYGSTVTSTRSTRESYYPALIVHLWIDNVLYLYVRLKEKNVEPSTNYRIIIDVINISGSSNLLVWNIFLLVGHFYIWSRKTVTI